MRTKVFFATFATLAVFVTTLGSAQAPPQFPTAIPQTKFAAGQNVVPYFEGWIRNADGSFDLVFGYFNRNWEQSLVIPAGPDNRVEVENPAGANPSLSAAAVDRGQPTFFLPRRQGWVYRVRVPSNFGKQVMRWSIKSNNKTESAYGELLPVEEITERIIMTRGNLNPGDDDPNKPPTLSIGAVEAATTTEPVTLTATVTDDGLPKPREAIKRTQAADATRIQQQTNSVATAQRRGLNVTWMELRGPGKIAFGAVGPTLVAEGKASTSARFPLPGVYVVRATANDGALATKSDLTITVR